MAAEVAVVAVAVAVVADGSAGFLRNGLDEAMMEALRKLCVVRADVRCRGRYNDAVQNACDEAPPAIFRSAGRSQELDANEWDARCSMLDAPTRSDNLQSATAQRRGPGMKKAK